jgi:hypothetical protein
MGEYTAIKHMLRDAKANRIERELRDVERMIEHKEREISGRIRTRDTRKKPGQENQS